MSRIRTIKPDFFEDEDLEELLNDTQQRLFIGLWCLADREGRLEDRPKWIKAKLFPHREAYNANGDLSVLSESGFIHRYSVGGKNFIWIPNFLKHQRPHTKESRSAFPSHEQADACTCSSVKSTTLPVQGHVEPGKGSTEGKGKEGNGEREWEGKGIENGKGVQGEGIFEKSPPCPPVDKAKGHAERVREQAKELRSRS